MTILVSKGHSNLKVSCRLEAGLVARPVLYWGTHTIYEFDIVTTQEHLVARLKPLGIRLTPQRLAIAEVVVNSADHPTVRDIFERVRDFFPYVTLATVYSTLALLERAGIVRELPFQKQSRYDANLSPHANLVCLGCGAVVDAEVGQEGVADLERAIGQNTDFQISSQRVDFYGYCEGCARNN